MRKSIKILKALFLLTAVLAVASPVILAHCEIPCGIYNDKMRIDMMKEDIETIEKSMNEINRLSAMKEINYNQIVRWVTNKDNHAERLYDNVTRYFMIQRIAPPKDAGNEAAQNLYIKRLTLLHQILLESIKAKQTTNLEHVKKLKTLVDEFDRAYFINQKHSH